MEVLNFVTREEPFSNGLFASVPRFESEREYVLLTGGTGAVLIVDEFTTPREIRAGKYKKLIGISKKTNTFSCTFFKPCREAACEFQVTLHADVQVENPIEYYTSVHMHIQRQYISITLDNPLRQIMMKYSAYEYLEMERELTTAFLNRRYVDDNTGLMYRITSVIVQPGEVAKKEIERMENMQRRQDLSEKSRGIVQEVQNKTYNEVIAEEVAQGKLSPSEGIRMVDEYYRSSIREKITMMDDLKKRGSITESEYESFVRELLPHSGNIAQNTLASSKQGDRLLNEAYIEEE